MVSWITTHPWLFAAVAAAAVATLWVARPFVRDVLASLAGAPAEVARVAAVRLRAEARRIDRRYRARVTEHLRGELEERLSRQTRQLEGRLQADLDRADATLMRLRDTAASVIQAADGADPTKIAAKVVADLQEAEGGERGPRGGALAKAVTRFETAARDARGSARALKPEARRITAAADKLRLIEHKLSRHAHAMNDAADRYERLVTSDERGKRAGDASIIVPWFAALLVIAIAAAGAVLNFQLLERPMSELVGGGARIGGIPLAALAAVTLILLEAAAGVVVMEAAGATQLLPVFRRMGRGMLAGFAIAGLFFLCVFSVVEVALAFTRDAIMALDADVLRAAAGEAPSEAGAAASGNTLTVALIAQALLGMTIPWILAIVAIPAETVIANTRFIVEALWKQTLSFASFALYGASALLRTLSSALMTVYDLAIFPALALQRLVEGVARRNAEKDEPAPESQRIEPPVRGTPLRPVGSALATLPAEVDDLASPQLESRRQASGGRS